MIIRIIRRSSWSQLQLCLCPAALCLHFLKKLVKAFCESPIIALQKVFFQLPVISFLIVFIRECWIQFLLFLLLYW
jgi:hypothetical protein